ncbi:MAG: hypothetical protein K2F87_04265, partial [Muribaculaceae bacterium]|nr:hypothetical protein [Muribaculaceae bacterium]
MSVTAGSGYADSYLFYQIADCKSIIKSGWIKASDNNITIPVEAPLEGNRVRVYLRGVHDMETVTESVTVHAAAENRNFLLTVDTFRDRINPASQEQWRFLFSCDGRPVRN